MTPNAFKVEVARFVGMERAEQIVQEIMQDEFFFDRPTTNVRDRLFNQE
jgi:hypothetical protein